MSASLQRRVLLPGATIGVFGSGQLGRMMALAARRMGYRVHTYSPETDSPTGQVADLEVCGAYDDLDAVRSFVRGVDVLTFEFENVSSAVGAVANDEGVPVRPGSSVLETAQHRLREKSALAAAGLPVTPFAAVRSDADLADALARIRLPAVLKTASFGYDGKGQTRVATEAEARSAWRALDGHEAILERHIDFVGEISVVIARGITGEIAHFGVIENFHAHHILDVSLAPARVSSAVAGRALEIASGVMETLDVVGVLCVEFFLAADEELLINEIAPRPHNSGHLTIEACITSQFEQQVRAVCGLPLGSTEYLRPAAMANLLGDLWTGGEPRWIEALRLPGVHLHLYGKRAARPGRKMGHLTALGLDLAEARRTVETARARLAAAVSASGSTSEHQDLREPEGN